MSQRQLEAIGVRVTTRRCVWLLSHLGTLRVRQVNELEGMALQLRYAIKGALFVLIAISMSYIYARQGLLSTLPRACNALGNGCKDRAPDGSTYGWYARPDPLVHALENCLTQHGSTRAEEQDAKSFNSSAQTTPTVQLAIVIPYISPEVLSNKAPLLKLLLSFNNKTKFPCSADTVGSYGLVFLHSSDEPTAQAARDALRNYTSSRQWRAKSCFRSIHFWHARIDREYDAMKKLYNRGANEVFRTLMTDLYPRLSKTFSHFVLLEADLFIARPQWLDSIVDEVRAAGSRVWVIGSNGFVPDHGPAGARRRSEQHVVTKAHIQDQPHYAVDAANQHGGESDSYDLFCAFGLLVDAGDGRGRVCRQLNGSLTCPVGCHPAAVKDDGASLDNNVTCVEYNAEHARSTPCDPVANWFWYRGSAPWCRFSPINGNAVYTLRDPCASLFWERNAVKDWQANAYDLLRVAT